MPAKAWAWCLYDFANSAFPTIISTFVIATYFTSAVAPNPVEGQAMWGWMQALAGLAIGILSPILGSVADAGGRRRALLALFTVLTALASAAIWFVHPRAEDALSALFLIGIATISFELGTVFYNAMLPTVAPAEKMGRISGIGWGIGYLGGLLCLGVSLVVLLQPNPAPFGLDRGAAEHVRATALLVGAWILAFGWPVLLAVPDPREKPPIAWAVREGLRGIRDTLKQLPHQPVLGRFLVARLFYTDGLNTLFAFGAIYAAGRFGMPVEEILIFGILLNVTAGAGAFAGGWLEDRLGSRRTVLGSLCAIILIGIALLLVESKSMFWVLGGGLGIFFGPAQAASRTLMARLAPPDQTAGWFGLFALSGRVTGFIGPSLLALTTTIFASQVAGMAVVLGLLGLGALLLLRVRAA